MMMNSDDDFIEVSVGRYKAFHHLIMKMNRRKLKPFCVPTLDIDLIWHSHQLYPQSYSKDTKAMHGKVIDHNDRDSGTLEGKKKMQLSFIRTKRLWEVIFAKGYSIGESLPLSKNKHSVLLCGTATKDSEDAAVCGIECFHAFVATKASEDAADCAGTECFYTCMATKVSEDAADCAGTECFHTCMATKVSEGVAVDASQCEVQCVSCFVTE